MWRRNFMKVRRSFSGGLSHFPFSIFCTKSFAYSLRRRIHISNKVYKFLVNLFYSQRSLFAHIPYFSQNVHFLCGSLWTVHFSGDFYFCLFILHEFVSTTIEISLTMRESLVLNKDFDVAQIWMNLCLTEVKFSLFRIVVLANLLISS